MAQQLFTNFSYKGPVTIDNNVHKVTVTYQYKNKPVHYYYFANKKEGAIKEARKEIDKLIKNNKLKRYSNRYVDYAYHNYRNRKIITCSGVLLAAGVIAGCSFLTWKYTQAPLASKVDFNFESETCELYDEAGEPISPESIVKGEPFSGIVKVDNEINGHLPGNLIITIDGKPLGVSDYKYDPSTGEFTVIPTGDIKILVEADESNVSFLYRYSSENPTVSFKTAPVVASTSYSVDWGDETDVETYSDEQVLEHTYSESTEEDQIYEIKILGAEAQVLGEESDPIVGFEQLVSMNFFNYSKTFAHPKIGEINFNLLEKIYFGKDFPAFIESGSIDKIAHMVAPNLNSIIVHDDNPNISDLNSNLVAERCQDSNGDEYYSVQIGCNNSVLPENMSIRRIGDNAFSYSNIESINIPSSVEGIYSNPFAGCKKLKKITVNSDSEYFTSRDINGKECNMVVTLQESESHFAQHLLIIGIPSSELPNDGTIEQIGELAYADIPIEVINIPDSVTRINPAAFWHCYNLKHINISPYASELVHFMNGNVEHVKMPQTIFGGFSQLEELIIPSKVVFYGGFLLDTSCSSITKVTCAGTTPPANDTGATLYKRSKPEKLSVIYVPNGAGQTYKTHPCWESVADLIQELPPVH